MLRSLVLAAALALGVASSPGVRAQECSSPDDDAKSILDQHNQPAAFRLVGEKAKEFAKRANAPDEVVAQVSHVTLWSLPDGLYFLVAFYFDGCRAGHLRMPVGAAPIAYRLRGA